MSDAPERIWATAYTSGIITTTVFHVGTNKEIPTFRGEYIRADLHDDLIKAADELVEAINHERNMVCQDFGMQLEASSRVESALIAYQQEKEKLG